MRFFKTSLLVHSNFSVFVFLVHVVAVFENLRHLGKKTTRRYKSQKENNEKKIAKTEKRGWNDANRDNKKDCSVEVAPIKEEKQETNKKNTTIVGKH